MNLKKFDIQSAKDKSFASKYKDFKEFETALRREYRYVTAYHATNLSLDELNSVKKNGLLKSTKELLFEKAMHRFATTTFTINNENLERSLQDYFNNLEDKIESEINFALVKDDLYDNYQYLLFGAESLLPIADYLKNIYHHSFRKILVDSGSHYIIKAIIPIELIEDKWIRCIYDYFYDSDFDISLVIFSNLNKDYIADIQKVERPKDIFNLILI